MQERTPPRLRYPLLVIGQEGARQVRSRAPISYDTTQRPQKVPLRQEPTPVVTAQST